VSPRRLTKRNVAAVIVAITVLLATGVLEGLFDRAFGPEAWGARFENVAAGVGDVVDVDGVRASVLSVESAYRLREVSDELVANGIFVIVRLRGEFPAAGRTNIGELAVLSADGIPTERVAGLPPQVSTGFWEESTVAFDVDPDRLTGLRLTIAQREVTFRYRTRAVVDLAIDERRAAEFRAMPTEHVHDVAETETGALP